MDKETKRIIYLHFKTLLTNSQSQVGKLRVDITILERREEEYTKILNQLVSVICQGCKGHGQTREWDGQDSYYNTCSACNGTGLANE